tara:strand:+ start:1127 stop:1315 length:189 start_codon:yes stop_codon:yes gene_type:complete
MTKQQTKQLSNIRFYMLHNELHGAAARGLSALIRSAMTAKSQNELMAEAVKLGINNHPEFIV